MNADNFEGSSTFIYEKEKIPSSNLKKIAFKLESESHGCPLYRITVTTRDGRMLQSTTVAGNFWGFATDAARQDISKRWGIIFCNADKNFDEKLWGQLREIRFELSTGT